MTYNAKNTTIVIAFAAVLVAMPLANTNAFATEIDAEMGGACGFSLTNLATMTFGSFIRTDDTLTVGEQEVQGCRGRVLAYFLQRHRHALRLVVR